jgi:serine/threonine-protein kinase
MVSGSIVHPGSGQLRAFAQGRLAGEEVAAVEQHLSDCPTCCLSLEATPVDSFVGRLQQACHLSEAFAADAGPPADAVPPELTRHPRYRAIRLLGQGGMGAVYLAEHRRMKRVVALKVINPKLLSHPGALARFQQEVRAAAQLDHPNIVAAHDADQADGLHFLVMEYVEGQNLADYLAEKGPLPVAEACDAARQAALGLQHAHERGTVHRDVKPHNLMRAPSGRLKLLDFGLARLAAGPGDAAEDDGASLAPHLTGAGAVVGTADYIAPEQARDAHGADGRVAFADIYQRLMSWSGHARQANTYRLRCRLFATIHFQRATTE